MRPLSVRRPLRTRLEGTQTNPIVIDPEKEDYIVVLHDSVESEFEYESNDLEEDDSEESESEENSSDEKLESDGEGGETEVSSGSQSAGAYGSDPSESEDSGIEEDYLLGFHFFLACHSLRAKICF